jgi:phenylalanyl-tRNA synthetase beta chain
MSNDISKMRGDLINGMLKSLSYNLNRQNKNLKFYEFGSVYSLEGNKYIEEKRLTILLCGNLIDNAWNSKNIESEIFILKNIIENIFLKFNIEPEIKQNNEVLEMNFNSSTAKIKKLDTQLLEKYNIEENNIYYATIPVDELFDNVSENYFKVEKQSKYPKVIRDFSFILNDGIKFIELQELISNTSKLIKKIDLVDVYKGSQIDNAKKSYSISVTIEEKKKTLDEIEINRISEKIIKNVNKELNGEIRS